MSTEDARVKPIILDGRQPAARQNARQNTGQSSPGALAMRQPSSAHAWLRGSVAALLVLAGIANVTASVGFPDNATVERLIVLPLSIDLFLAALALTVFAVLAATRRSVPVRPGRTSPMSVVALCLSGVTFVAWLLFGFTPTVAALVGGQSPAYLTQVGVIWVFGIPWILGMVLGTTSLRSGGPRTGLFGSLALAAGLVLALVVVATTILYGLGPIR